MENLKKYTQSEIERLALKGLEHEEQQKKYSLWHITKDLIQELENNKEYILEDGYPEDLVLEYVDSNISVYTYDQYMIYANNYTDLDIEGTDIEDIQGAIVYAIYEYLSSKAHSWLFEQQEKQEATA
tara:strand:+ start:311 stop:691 length:381 start_codon:yes stop_codon:yes gene_type:complete